MAAEVFRWVILSLYVLTLIVVATYGVHRYHLVYLYLKHRKSGHVPPKNYTDDELPRITIQLPMYNEQMVAERVIDAACIVDYPRDRLDIQVLDDSTDESAEIARKSVEKWQARGIDISYIHRNDRTGYKAGALAAATPQAKGEYIAIFDADFVPPVDMLRNVVNHFSDPKIGMVQVRWEHLNRDASLLTKGQAIFLDGHFVIEHTARNRSGRFMHFNGTAGVWRRETIASAGGWEHDTLTEDLDLSYRAQMKGWNFVYLPHFYAPAELPPEILAFKAQAHRWTKGSFQTALKLLPGILRSKKLPFRIKSEAFFHLTNTIVYPLMVLLTMIMYPAFICSQGPLKDHPMSGWLFAVTLFILATCSAGTFFCFAQRVLFGASAGWRTIMYLPYLMALGVGLSINNSKAVLEAIFTKGNSKSNEFVRTPKYGLTGSHATVQFASEMKRKKFPWSKALLAILEVSFGAYMATFIAISLIYHFALSAVPFLTIFAGGYFYVGLSSLWLMWQTHSARREAIVPEVELLS